MIGRILDRYVLKEIAPAFALGVGVFTFFLVIDRIYQLTDLVITKGVPFHLVLFLLVFLLPQLLTFTFPMAILVAVLLAAGRLAGDLEVTALKASGVSAVRLFRPFLVAALVVTLGSGALTLVVNPWATSAFQHQLFRIVQTRAVTAIRERTFSASFGQFTIYVEEVSPSQVALRGLLVSDERTPGVSRVIVAREGRLLTDDKARRVTLRFLDGQITETEAADRRRARHTAFALYDLNLPLDSAAGTLRPDKPERDLALGALGEEIARLDARGESTAPFRVEWHKRFALPLASLVFVLVGYPLAVRSSRSGRGAALALSLAIVVSYYVVFSAMENVALKGRVAAELAMWAANGLFAGVGLVLLVASVAPAGFGWAQRLGTLASRLARAAWPRRERAAEPAPVARRRLRSTFIVDRYLVREYGRLLVAGLAVGAVIFFVVDLLENLDRFLRTKPALVYILQHFALRLPGALYQGLPVVVLLATVFLFLSLTRQRELDALKAAGVSLYRVSVPVLALAGLVSVGAVAFQETLLPVITARAEQVDQVRIRGALPRHLQKRTQLWYRSSDTRFFRIELVDPVAQSLDDLTILDLDGAFHLRRRLDARRAQWTPDGWELMDGVVREVVAPGRVVSQPFARLRPAMDEHIDDFTRVQRPPDAMSFLELRAYVQKLQESGHQVGKYVVQLYSKLSFPVVHAIMALVAIPFALASPRGGGRMVGVGLAVMIAVGYWVVNSMAMAFAKADLLPPLLAAWTANILFSGIGAALFLRART